MVIIEPHGDDAILSCSSVLSKASLVVTVFKDRPSEGLKKYFPNLDFVCLGFSYTDVTQYPERMKPALVCELIKNGINPNKVSSEALMKKDAAMIEAMSSGLRKHIKSNDLVYSILGIWHPHHIIARLAASEISNNTVYYSEPSARFKRVGQLMERAAMDAVGITETKQLRVHPDKLDIFKKVYPTETYLIRGKDLESDYMQSEVFWKC